LATKKVTRLTFQLVADRVLDNADIDDLRDWFAARLGGDTGFDAMLIEAVTVEIDEDEHVEESDADAH
jgi:hypothetical protein